MQQSLESEIQKDIQITQQIISNSSIHIQQPQLQLSLLQYDHQQRQDRVLKLQQEVQQLRLNLNQFSATIQQEANQTANINEHKISNLSKQLTQLTASINEKIKSVKAGL